MATHTGTIHGNRIELSHNLGLPDGEEVEVQVLTTRKRQSGVGLARCAGALAASWTDADDQILSELQQARVQSTHRELPE